MHLNEKKERKYQILSGFELKLLAMITMLIDHVGAVLFPQYLVLRVIGRLAFPIYCFLLVEGAVHTQNYTKYAARLLLFAAISEVPFDLAFEKCFFYLGAQNVFFTLFLGLVGIWMIKKWDRLWFLGFSAAIVAHFLKTDYGAIGVCFILVLYCLYEKKIIRLIALAILNGWSYLWTVQMYASFSVIPLFLYNGKRGKNIKYVFYIFYPLHLLILYFIWRGQMIHPF